MHETFEYKIIELEEDRTLSVKELNKYGQDGWELVSVNTITDVETFDERSYSDNYITYFFKRKIKKYNKKYKKRIYVK